MYNVLIIEDEPPILRGICNSIRKCSIDFEIKDTAFNGEEAIALLEHNYYDLIITDINMPVKDGFSVLKYLKDNSIDSIRIILSGYEEFSYAKKALSYNIKDYLVKPIDKEKLSNLLKEVAFEIEDKKFKEKQNSFNNLIHHKSSSLTTKKFDAPHIMMLFCAGAIPYSADDFLSLGYIYWEEADLVSKVENNNSIMEYWIVDGSSLSEKILIASYDANRKKSIASDLLESLVNDKISITIAVSDEIEDYSSIYSNHIQLRKLIESKSVFSKSSILYLEDKDAKTADNRVDFTEFKLALKVSDEKNLLSSIKGIINEMQKKQLTFHQVKNTLNYIIIKLLENFTYEYNSIYATTLVEEIMLNANDYKELQDALLQFLDKLQSSSSYYDDKEKLAKKIKQYIDENLNTAMTNQTLSQQFHLVPSYISSIFKSNFGTSTTEYIINTRIDKAKKLMEVNPDILTKDIAKAVGYSDPLYFSKVFKKKTGFSPSQFAKNAAVD